jgi:hypothetical protein
MRDDLLACLTTLAVKHTIQEYQLLIPGLQNRDSQWIKYVTCLCMNLRWF